MSAVCFDLTKWVKVGKRCSALPRLRLFFFLYSLEIFQVRAVSVSTWVC